MLERSYVAMKPMDPWSGQIVLSFNYHFMKNSFKLAKTNFSIDGAGPTQKGNLTIKRHETSRSL